MRQQVLPALLARVGALCCPPRDGIDVIAALPGEGRQADSTKKGGRLLAPRPASTRPGRNHVTSLKSNRRAQDVTRNIARRSGARWRRWSGEEGSVPSANLRVRTASSRRDPTRAHLPAVFVFLPAFAVTCASSTIHWAIRKAQVRPRPTCCVVLKQRTLQESWHRRPSAIDCCSP